MRSNTVRKSSNDLKRPADIAQVTFLFDQSDSMCVVESEARAAIETVMNEFADKDGMVFAVRIFCHEMKTISDFGADLKSLRVDYRPYGSTFLYRSITDSINLSIEDAKLTPEIKVHHVMVIVTDGQDRSFSSDDLEQCRKAIADNDVHTTYIMMDFSPHADAGKKIGLKGIPFSQNPADFIKAMKKLVETISQIADNVVKQLPPSSGLILPPAR